MVKYQLANLIAELFKVDSKGKYRVWRIFADGAMYWTEAGLVDGGKMNVSAKTECFPKNEGKSNETTGAEQAILEAESKVRKKRREGKGMHDTQTLALMASQNKFTVMLAKKYLEEFAKGKVQFPQLLSPKLDGVRMWNKFCQRSRGNKDFASTPHLDVEIDLLQSRIAESAGLSAGNRSMIVDGELYNHELKADFEKLISLIKKQKPNEEQLKESEEKIQYHVFDFCPDAVSMYDGADFKERYELLSTIFNKENFKYLKLVNHVEVNDNSEVEAFLKMYIEQGYEGVMLKDPRSLYVQKKCGELLKYKLFKDDEFEILEISDAKGNWKGAAKAIKFLHPNGEEFEATLTGTRERARTIYEVREALVGKMATVSYQEETKRGVPRFGTVIAIRDYE